jgi:type I restriction enzyme S subunit
MIGEIGSTDVQEKRELPDGWRWVKLGKISKIVGGSTPDTGESAYWGNDIVWVTPTDLGKLSSIFINGTSRNITPAGLLNCGTELVPAGTVVMSSRAPIGHLAIAEQELCTNQGCKSFVPSSEVDSLFLYWSLKKAVPDIQALGSGATFAEVSKSKLQEFEIPLPPLPEQQRIAALLKEQMAAVDNAREAAEERLAAIKALPAAFLRQVFPESDQPLPNGWRWVKLGDVCKVVGGAQPPKSFFRYDAHPDYIRLVQIQDFRLSDVAVYIPKYMAVKTFDESDVMIGRYGPPVFQILRGLSGAYNVALMKTETSSALNKDYLYFILQWPNIQNAVIAQSQRAAGQSGVQKEFLENYTIPLPVLSEQQRIASQLKEQFTAVDTARKSAEAELETINALPAALLRRAFNGEL